MKKQKQFQQIPSKNKNIVHIFLFINSGSGGGVGQKLVKQQIQKIQFTLPINHSKEKSSQKYQQEINTHVYFYNLRKNKEVGMKRLKGLIQQNQKTLGVVCGGDGTVMWVVQQFIDHQIDPWKVPLAIIPLGTGNDFSRNLGWGGQQTDSLTSSGYKNLKKLIHSWVTAKQEYFDLWDIQAQIFQYGKFEVMKDEKSTLLPGTTVKKTFCNYFSFGIDGKIGYSFDKYRTKSRIGNLMVYGGLGLLKSITKTKNVKELVSSMIQEKVDQVKQAFDRHSLKQLPSNSKLMMEEKPQVNLANSKISQKKLTKKDIQRQRIMENQYLNLLALNIDSFTGGTNQIWKNAKCGLRGQQKEQYKQQDSSDGLLQFVSFQSGMGIALQKVIKGNAKKIAQGKGPFLIQFNQNKQQKKYRTYLQIDGQFIRFTNPKRITIMKSTLVPDGKIKVLRNMSQII